MQWRFCFLIIVASAQFGVEPKIPDLEHSALTDELKLQNAITAQYHMRNYGKRTVHRSASCCTASRSNPHQ